MELKHTYAVSDVATLKMLTLNLIACKELVIVSNNPV
jgi:hypothetical protein